MYKRHGLLHSTIHHLTGSASHRLVASSLCTGCPSPPLQLVWMNVSSLSPWLSDFLRVWFSVSSGCFLFLNCCCPSFGCARRHSVSTYVSILAGSHSFFEKHQITQVTQPPYSPDLVPCNFWLFQKLKSPLKGKRFQTINEIQENMMGQLMTIGKILWGPKVPTSKGTEMSLSYVQCFLYLLQ